MYNDIKYYKNGKIQYERIIDSDGVQNGVEKWYWESGHIWYETSYLNNKIHGIRKRYTNKGIIANIEFWYNDEMVTEEFYTESNRQDKLNKILKKRE